MKNSARAFYIVSALGLAFSACAPAQRPQPSADAARAPMDHGAMDMDAMMPQMMAMHERMAADSVIHERMMADTELRAAMSELMGHDVDPSAMHAHMASMTPAERQAMRTRMHEQMMARMEAMPATEREALMHRMMEAHHRLMEDPVVRQRMMADPEMHQMMQHMRQGGHGEHGDH
jgi:hypothetical protein